MQKIELWIITISSDRSITDIAARLKAEGLTICDLLEDIGCITGEADNATAERLKHIDGVVDIAPDMPIDLGPPDSNQAW
ncbi:hypothetical protein B0H98_102354 [Vreelandella songnenensis]|uniref:Uncharacterized protein n=1 Tax=Vreelandella songnenensis TaxID=1176243 RepID=A0A2T0V6K7_9GAMM|nr:hypothetical protein [Halomonas songnenensis]PRY65822.1 hypothetical protein B0H98_102354 [Halomonas songnenensis]